MGREYKPESKTPATCRKTLTCPTVTPCETPDLFWAHKLTWFLALLLTAKAAAMLRLPGNLPRRLKTKLLQQWGLKFADSIFHEQLCHGVAALHPDPTSIPPGPEGIAGLPVTDAGQRLKILDRTAGAFKCCSPIVAEAPSKLLQPLYTMMLEGGGRREGASA